MDMPAQPNQASTAERPVATGGLRAAGWLLTLTFLALGAALSYAVDTLGGVLVMAGALFAWRGFNSGLIKCICSLTAALSMFAWAGSLGRKLAGELRLHLDWPAVPLRLLGVLTAAAAILLLGQILGCLLQRGYTRRHGSTGRNASVLGLALGLLEGGVIAWCLVNLLLVVEVPTRMGLSLIMEREPWAGRAYDQVAAFQRFSRAAGLNTKLAPGSQSRRQMLELGGALALISGYPEVIHELKTNPMIVELMSENPAMGRVETEVRRDWDLKAAVKSGDLWGMLDSPTVLRMIDDDRLARAVGRHYDDLFDAILASIPPAYKDQAFRDIARLHGRDLDDFVEEAESRRRRGTALRIERERWWR